MEMVMTPAEVKELRAQLKMTQEKFAHHLGVCLESVKKWEQGRGKPSPMAVREMMRAKENDMDGFGL